MSQIREAIEAAVNQEDTRRFGYELGKPNRNAHSRQFLARLLRRMLENVDGDLTVAELIQELDEVIE